jgi:hypothetical protein
MLYHCHPYSLLHYLPLLKQIVCFVSCCIMLYNVQPDGMITLLHALPYCTVPGSLIILPGNPYYWYMHYCIIIIPVPVHVRCAALPGTTTVSYLVHSSDSMSSATAPCTFDVPGTVLYYCKFGHPSANQTSYCTSTCMYNTAYCMFDVLVPGTT